MSFVELNAAVTTLRDALRAYVGTRAIKNIDIRPPSGDDDEASFLRLASWSFVLIFEAGRVSVAFLLKVNLPDTHGATDHKRTKQHVQQLRTWLFHNVGFDSRDLGMRREVADWFITCCGNSYPETPAHWKLCFNRLATDVRDLAIYCSGIVSRIAASSEDSGQLFNDLRHRIDRQWDAHEFDKIVSNAAARLGRTIDSRQFRETRLNSWRNYLEALPEDADFQSEMERLIDSQVYTHFQPYLPVSTRELALELGLDPGPAVEQAMEQARTLYSGGLKSREDILRALIAERQSSV